MLLQYVMSMEENERIEKAGCRERMTLQIGKVGESQVSDVKELLKKFF